MLSAVVDAQYGGYDLDPQYMQQVQQPSRLNFQQALQYSQPSFQPWQQSGGPTFQDYQQQSSYTQVVSPSDQCGKIADDNGVIPFKEWGKLTESMKTTWGQQGCDQEMCQYWAKKYHIAPFESGGTMPKSIFAAWDHEQMQCNFRVGPYSPAQCKAASAKFRTYPIGIWGSMPEYARMFWTQGNCDVKMCGIWKETVWCC
ncbi:hypothetical protein BASA61_001983 [Batrachochytrium salamandrivorans]|nr:hypothetical protein BASA61_001983 [Batrachochytrium salamandrivorans]